MNSGYIVHVEPFGEGVEDAEQAGQKTTDGSWDWLVKPADPYATHVNREEGERRSVDYLYGEATWTTKTGEDRVTVTEDGDIRTREETRRERHAAEFLVIPSEEIGIVSDTSSLYYIEQAFTALEVSEQEINLRGLVDALDVDQWGVGFAGRPVGNGGEKGALYGKRVAEDPDLGEDIQQTPLSDVGFEHFYDHEQLKAYLAASGYVAAYGDEWSSQQFIPWVIDIVAPHLRKREDGEDEDQATLDEAADESGGEA